MTTATKAVDVVGVYDADFNQVFPDARPLKAFISDESAFFKHPLESSATRTDHVIFLPVKIVMTMVIPGKYYRNVYKQVKNVYTNQTQLIVQTKVETYENMYIQGIPYEDTHKNFDSVVMRLNLNETKIAETTITFSPESSSDSDTIDRGRQDATTTTDAQEEKGSTLSRWFS